MLSSYASSSGSFHNTDQGQHFIATAFAYTNLILCTRHRSSPTTPTKQHLPHLCHQHHVYRDLPHLPTTSTVLPHLPHQRHLPTPTTPTTPTTSTTSTTYVLAIKLDSADSRNSTYDHTIYATPAYYDHHGVCHNNIYVSTTAMP